MSKQLIKRALSFLLLMVTAILIVGCSNGGNNYIPQKNDNSDNQKFTGLSEKILTVDMFAIPIDYPLEVLFEATLTNKNHDEVTLMDSHEKKIGILKDDGQGNDTKKNDGVYTGNFELSYDTPQEVSYYVLVGNKKSNFETITFYEEKSNGISNEDIKEEIRLIESTYKNNENGSIDEKLAVEIWNELITYLKGLKNNGDIVTYKDNLPTLEIKLTSGLTYVHIFNLSNESTLSKNQTDTGTLLTLEPYAHDGNRSSIDSVTNSVSNKPFKYEVTNLHDEMVTLDVLKRLNDYNVVILVGHGNSTSCIATGEKSTDEAIAKYPKEDFNKGYVVNMDGYFGVNYKFFNKYYNSNSFKKSLVYLGSCYSADDERLAETFINKGADTVLAYANIVRTEYETDMSTAFFNALSIKKDNKATTAGEALKQAKSKHGKKDPVGSKWNDFIFGWKTYRKESYRAELKLFGNEDFTLISNEDSQSSTNSSQTNSNSIMDGDGITNENTDTYTFTNDHFSWSLDLPKVWQQYGFIEDKNKLTGYMDSSFYHAYERNNYLCGWVFTIMADNPTFFKNSGTQSRADFGGVLAETNDYVFYWLRPTDLQVDEKDPNFEKHQKEYNSLYETRESVLASFRLNN